MIHKVLSKEMRHYRRNTLNELLCSLSDGERQYTHYFNFLEGNVKFLSKDQIRECLWTLEKEGLVKNINLGTNIHQWQITEAGIKHIQTITLEK